MSLSRVVSLLLVMVGEGVAVAGVSLWTVPAALILAGVCLVADGLLLVDVR